MLLLKLVAYSITLTYLASSGLVIAPVTKTVKHLSDCIDQIYDKYIKPTDLVVLSNLKNLDNIQFNMHPVVIMSSYEQELIQFHFKKVDMYVITTSEESFIKMLTFLANSPNWNPRARFIIVFEGKSWKLFHILQAHYVFNVVVLLLTSATRIDVFTYFPYDFSVSENERTKPVSINICIKGKYQKKLDFFPNKLPNNWSNTTLRMIFLAYPPYVVRLANAQIVGGFEANLFKIVQKRLGFKFDFSDTFLRSWDGEKTSDINKEIREDLQQRRADAAIGFLWAKPHDFLKFDVSFPYIEDSFKWVVPMAVHQPPWKSIVKVFNWKLWILVIISMVVISLTMPLVGRHLVEVNNYRSLLNCFIISFQTLVSQGIHILPKTAAVRIVLFVWMLLVFIMSAAFQSKLTSVLNFITYERQISTIEELERSKIMLGFVEESQTLFSGNNSRILSDSIVCDTDTICLDRTAFRRNFATVAPKRRLQFMVSMHYLDSDGTPLVYIFKGNIFTVLINIVFTKGFPMVEQINKVLINLKSSGFIQYYYKRVDYFTEKAYLSARHAGMSADVLELAELEGIFGLLVIGWISASVIFVIELLVGCCLHCTVATVK